jgi:hypothetical protein
MTRSFLARFYKVAIEVFAPVFPCSRETPFDGRREGRGKSGP